MLTRYGLLHGTATSVSRHAMSQEMLASKPQTDSAQEDSDVQRQAQQPAGVTYVEVKEAGLMTEDGWMALGPAWLLRQKSRLGNGA